MESRRKILDAALQEFTEKGFEGARVDKIAKRAGVSKALIYYTFDSKEALLTELIEELRKRVVQHLSNTYAQKEKISDGSKFARSELQESIDFILENRQYFRILLLESLKTKPMEEKMLGIWGEINQDVRSAILNQRGYQGNFEKIDQHVVDFFFIFMPTIIYSIWGREWAANNGFDLKDVNQRMIAVVEGLYDQYM